jgi:signal transduction histidine kinase
MLAPSAPLPRPVPPRPPLVGRLAISFVFIAMAALVVVPLLVQSRVDSMRARLEHAAEPARTEVARVQFALATEMAALHRYLEMGEPEALRSYDEARALERQALQALRTHARALGPQVLEPYVRLETLAAEWQGRIEGVERGPGGHLLPEGRAGMDPVLLEGAVRAATEVDEAVVAVAERSRAEIRRTQRLGRAVTLALGALALLAAGTVIWLYRRMRGLTALAEFRQATAERALDERERALDARTRLLHGVTHDVKNPLGAARGYAELLEMGVKGPLAPEQARYVVGIRRSIDGALAILADLLDLARADGGGLRVERIPVDLAWVAGEAVEEYRSKAEAAGHEVDFPARQEPVRCFTDPDRVRQVLGNLLSNATKYTPPPGRITIRTEEVEGGATGRPGRWAAVHVADTGPGVPPEHREAIFAEFHRLEEGSGVPGHGLGLAIARRVAELLGGELTVDEAPGGGALFSLWLPLRDGATPEDGA